MKPAQEIIAELRRRGLYDFVELVAQKHQASVEDVVRPEGARDFTAAKHAVWARLADHFENVSAVARIWGVHHTSIRWAVDQCSPEVVHVELASFKSIRGAYAFGYGLRAEGHAFYIRDRVSGRTTWYVNGDPITAYHLARDVFQKCCEEAGEPSFRSVSLVPGGVS